jgi:hypothetical protein
VFEFLIGLPEATFSKNSLSDAGTSNGYSLSFTNLSNLEAISRRTVKKLSLYIVSSSKIRIVEKSNAGNENQTRSLPTFDRSGLRNFSGVLFDELFFYSFVTLFGSLEDLTHALYPTIPECIAEPAAAEHVRHVIFDVIFERICDFVAERSPTNFFFPVLCVARSLHPPDCCHTHVYANIELSTFEIELVVSFVQAVARGDQKNAPFATHW